MTKTGVMPYIVGFISGLIVTGLVLTNLDTELTGRLQRRMADDMIRVSGGSFVMGCAVDADWGCVEEEEPAQTLKLDAFEIDRFEVTSNEYEACVDAGVCFYRGSILDQRRTFKNGRGNHPINFVSWVEAHTFCVWRGKRLPTDAEWEKAARGPDGLRFPWGNEPVPSCELAVVDEDDESFLERRREAWAEEKVEELVIDSDSSDDEGPPPKTPVLVAPSPLRELPPELQKTLDVFLTNTATPAQLKEAAETTAEALKACLTAGGLEQPSDDDSVDDPEAFAIKAKYESAKIDYEAAMKSALDEKSGFGDSEDEDAQWPPDASGFMGTETPQTSPKKPRKTTPPVARRPPKKKAAFVVPRRGSKDAVHL